MRISVTEARGRLTELVRRAEAGDEVVLTRRGHAVMRLVPVKTATDGKSRRALLEAARAAGASKADAGPGAAREAKTFSMGMVGFPDDRGGYRRRR